MKKIMLIIVIINCILLNLITYVFAKDDITIILNRVPLQSDVNSIIINDRVLVPLRAISEALNCEVFWNENTLTANIKNPLTIIGVQINNTQISKKDRGNANDSKILDTDVAPIIYYERTLVPLRAIAEAFNADVEWNAPLNQVEITMKYSYINDYCDELSLVGQDGKYGYVDQQGNEVIPLIYDFAWNFSDGIAPVQKDKKWGCIDTSGNTVIPFTYDYFFGFAKGSAAVSENGKWKFIDTNNNSFSGDYQDLVYFNGEISFLKKDGKWGVVKIDENKNIKIDVDFIYDYLDFDFDNSVALVQKDGVKYTIDMKK